MLGSLWVGLGVALGTAYGFGPTESPSWLRWDAPPTCPDAAYVSAAVEERLGRAPSHDEIEVHATVVDGGPRGVVLELATTPASGPTDARRLEAHDCRALADAAALLVALSVDPVAVAAISAARAGAEADELGDGGDPVAADPDVPQSEESEAPAIETVPPVSEPARSARADAQPRPSSVPAEVLLHVVGGPEIGALPGVAGGASAAMGLGWSRLRFEIGALWIGVRTRDEPLASVRVQMAGAVVRACARVGARRIEVPLCGGIDFGAVIGAGDRGAGTRTAFGPWIAPHVAAGVHGWVRPRLAVVGRVEVAVPALSTAFVAQEPGPEVEIFRTGPVSARFWVGLETKFPIGRDGSSRSRRMGRGRP